MPLVDSAVATVGDVGFGGQARGSSKIVGKSTKRRARGKKKKGRIKVGHTSKKWWEKNKREEGKSSELKVKGPKTAISKPKPTGPASMEKKKRTDWVLGQSFKKRKTGTGLG